MAIALVVDHVTVAGSDLKAMQAHLASVGIKSEYGGPHSNHATEMALTSFPDGSYLELIAIPNGADEKAVSAHYWSKQLRGDAGPTAWAIRSKDIAADVAQLKQMKALVGEPVRAGRERPDGVRLDWETANIGSEPNGTFFPFLIHDVTPRQQRAMPSGKPTTQDYSGVSRAVVAVRELPASAMRYRKTLGLAAPVEQADPMLGANLLVFKGTPLVLAAPASDKSPLAARLRDFGEGPCAFVLHSRKSSASASAVSWKITWFDAAKLGWWLGVE